MEDIILRTNATPVYGFLSVINTQAPLKAGDPPKKILDCGAGGPVPPLALFHHHGFETCGIDTSEDQLEKARQFCQQNGITCQIRLGDMRQIPFPDETFDCVYEHYSMCHLSKADTALAVREMYRVLKLGGLCLLGVISTASWPKSLFGEEKEPGEFWGEEGGNPNVLHSMFDDQAADGLVSAWEILIKERQVRYLREAAAETSLDAWMDLLGEAQDECSRETWQASYPDRANAFQYAHTFYYLRKP